MYLKIQISKITSITPNPAQVKVPPQHMTTAVLEVFEDELGGEFEVVTEFVGKVCWGVG